jgi:hypothetical protein
MKKLKREKTKKGSGYFILVPLLGSASLPSCLVLIGLLLVVVAITLSIGAMAVLLFFITRPTSSPLSAFSLWPASAFPCACWPGASCIITFTLFSGPTTTAILRAGCSGFVGADAPAASRSSAFSPVRWTGSTCHVRRYHRHYKGSGHVWQGRYKCFPCQPRGPLMSVLRCVERNPVRAGIVKRAQDWRFSSAAAAGSGEMGSGSAKRCLTPFRPLHVHPPEKQLCSE